MCSLWGSCDLWSLWLEFMKSQLSHPYQVILQKHKVFLIVLQLFSSVAASIPNWDCRALVLRWLKTVRYSCGDVLKSIIHTMRMEVQLFYNLIVTSYLLSRPFGKNWGNINMKYVCRPMLKEFLAQEACHVYQIALSDIQIFDFCEKGNRNSKTNFVNFAVSQGALVCYPDFPWVLKSFKIFKIAQLLLGLEKISVL